VVFCLFYYGDTVSNRMLFQDVRRIYQCGNTLVVSLPKSAIGMTVFKYRKTVKVSIYRDKIVIVPFR
jgi:hypothetical protein